MHSQIDRLKEGDERACDNCGRIYEAIYFPYKSVNHCIDCYEKMHGVILHKYRKRINRNFFVKKTRIFERNLQVCPICQAESLFVDKGGNKICRNCEKIRKNQKKLKTKQEGTKCPACGSVNYEKKGFRNTKQRYICKECGRNWTSNKIVENLVYRKSNTKDNLQRENTLEEIVVYLKSQKENNMPLKFWYRNDTEPRETYDYFIDEKYVNVHSDKGYFIRFLINKIRKI